MQGFLFKDPVAGTTVVVDGIIASLFYAFDRYSDKVMINATLARNFGFAELKNARILLYQAFSLGDENGKMTDKRTEETLLKDIWEKVTKIDMTGHGNVVVCMPYNFTIPQFISDADFLSETARGTSNTMMMEKMTTLEKKVDEKNTVMFNMLQSIMTRMNQPTITAGASYAGVAGFGHQQGRPQHLQVPGGGGGARDRSPSVKRGFTEVAAAASVDNKRRNVDKTVTGTRSSDKSRKMKSPPADIFVYGVPRDTSKMDIMEDLAESDIHICVDDINLMSKGNPPVVSYRISVKADDLTKALDPMVWPLRVKVREFIHYKKRPNAGKTTNQSQQSASRQRKSSSTLNPTSSEGMVLNSENRFSVLNNDVEA